jgi:hypothetical protein
MLLGFHEGLGSTAIAVEPSRNPGLMTFSRRQVGMPSERGPAESGRWPRDSTGSFLRTRHMLSSAQHSYTGRESRYTEDAQ